MQTPSVLRDHNPEAPILREPVLLPLGGPGRTVFDGLGSRVLAHGPLCLLRRPLLHKPALEERQGGRNALVFGFELIAEGSDEYRQIIRLIPESPFNTIEFSSGSTTNPTSQRDKPTTGCHRRAQRPHAISIKGWQLKLLAFGSLGNRTEPRLLL